MKLRALASMLAIASVVLAQSKTVSADAGDLLWKKLDAQTSEPGRILEAK